MSRKHHVVLPSDDTVCELCGEIAEVRTHGKITGKQLSQPFYYSKWYNCKNRECRRTLFMFDEDRVFNKNSAARDFQLRDRNSREFEEQASFLRSIS